MYFFYTLNKIHFCPSQENLLIRKWRPAFSIKISHDMKTIDEGTNNRPRCPRNGWGTSPDATAPGIPFASVLDQNNTLTKGLFTQTVVDTCVIMICTGSEKHGGKHFVLLQFVESS